MIGNGPMGNRGCQAIEQSTLHLLMAAFPDAEFTIGNYHGDLDAESSTDPRIKYFKLRLNTIRRHSLGHIGWKFLKSSPRIFLRFLDGYRSVVPYLPNHDLVLSLGGDLYSTVYGPLQVMNYVAMGEAAMNAGKPFVIWPATLGPFQEDNYWDKLTLDHIRRCKLVLCRDDFSMKELNQHGIAHNTCRVADPAFTLQPFDASAKIDMAADLHNSIGMNIGPNLSELAAGGSREQWISSAVQALSYVVERTDRQIILIPHVVNQRDDEPNCDYIFMTEVCQRLSEKGISLPILPPTLTAAELKWVISQLHSFIGSRTHSTIAAFSSGVPCGCIGYSAKSSALCEIFYGGNELHLPCQQFTPETLLKLVRSLTEGNDQWSTKISNKLPEVLELAYASVKSVKQLFQCIHYQ